MTLAASTTRTVRPRHHCGLLPRILLAKLVALFFIVHPGSCATFNSRKFLTQRYPNRDVIPACLLHQQQQQQQRRRDATNVLAGAPAAAGSSSFFIPLFIRTPAISPCSSSPSSSSMTPRSFASQVARPVVIGSFVSELESSNMDRRRNGVKHQLQQQASQLLSSNLFQSSNNNNNNKAPATGITTRKMTNVHGGATSSSSSLNVGGLFQKSAATMVDVYDGVLSFVGSRIVTTEMTFNKAFSAVSSSMVAPLAAAMEGNEQEARMRSNSQPQLSVRPTGGSSSSSSFGPPLSSSFSTSSLVGYLDVDPFEKSKKHFKRNTSLAKLLL